MGSLVCLYPQVIFLAPLPRVLSSLDDFRYVSGAGTLGPVVRPKVKERCKGPSHGRDGEHWVRLGGPELGGVCWENRTRQEGNVDSQCGPRCPATVTTRLLMKTLTIPRALRATLEQSQLHTRQKGTRLLTDPRPLSPHLQPLQGGGLCGAQTFGVPSTPSRRKYLLSVQTHLNERLRRKIQNLGSVSLAAPLEFTFVDEKLLERSCHGLWESFHAAFLCAPAVPGSGDSDTRRQARISIFPLSSVPVSPPSTFSLHSFYPKVGLEATVAPFWNKVGFK